MAGQEWKPHAALKARLASEGHRFSFFQAVQLLHRLRPDGVAVGELGPPAREAVRFRHDPNLVFHASDIARIRFEADNQPAELTSTFLGLTGSTSPLSTAMCEDALHAAGEDSAGLLDFYDIFHHRLLSLLYRAWKKYRFAASFRTGGADAFTRRALAFVGVDIHGAVPARGLPPTEQLALAPLLSIRTRPAWMLQIVLERLLGDIPVRIEQFVLRWAGIEQSQRVCLAKHHTSLSVDLTIGKRVQDRSGRFRVRIGPVAYEVCESLMPGGAHYPVLRDVVEQFTRGILEPELVVELQEAAAPSFQLGSERSARLGVTTRLPTRERRRSLMRTVLSDQAATARPELLSE